MRFKLNDLISKGKLFVVRHGPEILVFSGAAGMVTSTVMACFATRKLDTVLDEHKKNAEEAHKNCESQPENEKKELTKVYLKTGVAFVGLYGPSVTVGALSLTGILAGNHILRKRNVALAAAYATVDAGFRQYRDRVVQRYGEQADLELLHDGHQEKIEVMEKDENGKEKKVKKNVTVLGSGLSGYARYFAFGEAAAAERNMDYNKFFLNGQLELARHQLRVNKYLFLNDVYDMLGIPKSIAGQTVGWLYDPDGNSDGDNYVDFGIKEVYRKCEDGSTEKVLLLDFNVDGNIMNAAKERGLITD